MTDNTEIKQEKRRFARIPGKIPIEISSLTYPLPLEPDGAGIGKDIGGGGICFILPSEYKPGTICGLKMDLKGWRNYKKTFYIFQGKISEQPLSAIGEIVWCRAMAGRSGYEVGLKFLDIYEDDYQALMKYLEALD